MWGLFVGLAIGIAQVFAMRVLIKMIMGTQKALGMLLLLLKFAAVVAVLWLISTIDLMNLIWAAGGMLAGLIIGFAILHRTQKRAGKDGKDQRDA